MRFRALAHALRNQPLPALFAEAAWRGLRSGRKAMFRLSRTRVHGPDSPVAFHPIGYYRVKEIPQPARDAILAYAEAIIRGEFPLMGYGSPWLGLPPDWHVDWVSGKSWLPKSTGKMQIVRHDGSDVKAPWELSRLQWGVVVAKAFVLTGEQKYRKTLKALLADWMLQNPVGTGVNWTVAMEAALRGISLCLLLELLWPFADDEQVWLDTMTASLWQHLRFIEAHNEFSFLVRSNHYLSNIVGLATLSTYLDGPGMERRRRKYARAVEREILLQTYADGGDREASTGYHVLVTQLALHSLVVQQRLGSSIAPEFEARVRLMFAWIAALSDDDWKLPHLGDCDNGRVELLTADIAQAALPATERHSLRVGGLIGLASHSLQMPLGGDDEDAAWFDGTSGTQRPDRPPVSLLPESGLAVLRTGEASVVFCAMPNGLGGKGSHTHCDKLSIVFHLGEEEVFADSGSRGYTRSATLRNLDRSTQAHTTLTIDDAEQNVIPTDPQLLFRCGNQAAVTAIVLPEAATAQASHRGYARYGIEHQRTVQLNERSLLLVDDVSGLGEHSLALHFILAPGWSVSSEMMTDGTASCCLDGPRQLALTCEGASELRLSVAAAEISREYGAALPASCLSIQTTARLPAQIRTVVRWN